MNEEQKPSEPSATTALLKQYYSYDPMSAVVPFDQVLAEPIPELTKVPKVTPTRMKKHVWAASGEVDKFAAMAAKMHVGKANIFDRVENLLQAIDPDANIGYLTTGKGVRVTIDNKPLLDVHLWVPTKKKTKHQINEHIHIPMSVCVKIPEEVRAFIGLKSDDSILGPTIDYHRKSVLTHRSPKVLKLPKYPFSTWELRQTDDGQQLVIEIHHSTKLTKHAMQAVIYLN